MTLVIDTHHAGLLRRRAAAAYPEECCGVLGGRSRGGVKSVEAVVPLPNRHRTSPGNRYLTGPDDMRLAEETLRTRGLEPIGFYHSHPDAPAQPSRTDLEQATWPGLSYVIVSVTGGEPGEITSWTLAEDRSRFDAEPLRDQIPAA